MNLQSKVALITGITGQDGSLLSKFLLEKGYKIFGIIRDTSLPNIRNLEYLGILDDVKLLKVNLLDLSNIINEIDKIHHDEIYHLSGHIPNNE